MRQESPYESAESSCSPSCYPTGVGVRTLCQAFGPSFPSYVEALETDYEDLLMWDVDGDPVGRYDQFECSCQED